MINRKLEYQRKLRRKTTSEDFTPPELVLEMLDKLPTECFTENKTFCDPAAGNGNFLIEVLKKKLHHFDPLKALSSIYGIELMPDNVEEMKLRLLELIPRTSQHEAKKILEHNIVCHDALTWDFENWKELNKVGSDMNESKVDIKVDGSEKSEKVKLCKY
jgi:type I restriction-modification system DNA methylase subunit